MKDIINQLNKKLDLNFLDMQQAINNIMTGAVNDIEIENFLLLLNAKRHNRDRDICCSISYAG